MIVYDGDGRRYPHRAANPTNDPSDRFGAAVAWVGDDAGRGAARRRRRHRQGRGSSFDERSPARLLHTSRGPTASPVGSVSPSPAPAAKRSSESRGLLERTARALSLRRDDGCAARHARRPERRHGGGPLWRHRHHRRRRRLRFVLLRASAVYRFDAGGTLLQTYQDPEPADARGVRRRRSPSPARHVAIGVGLSLEPRRRQGLSLRRRDRRARAHLSVAVRSDSAVLRTGARRSRERGGDRLRFRRVHLRDGAALRSPADAASP